ncbi:MULTISPECIES: sigma-54-dependent Fis family transcriptional regulator [Thermoactinomyces]|uniref:Sigma-54-dependent transcriptional regulator n=1 Tax=Thermoactinomyces vulgaris TaxID=2026 RepID=A0ABS0QDW5_THEVU|nr:MULTISPECIES: sigma-54-dependent Fis family transcriptional regulator [Thermoactinomyces]KFZ39617.1 ATPase AAA [Thermoactinomyces sp. Gus2-1]KYQ87765.1 AAA family ATPase [Thermoactinomyces sp. AS95]MBA4550338.1 sigma-54-dependent transcriptional regulator [Thermoactinomyces vulgaris]MBA4595749.1 sigma-54-dependent transcriptional regulator [Thermoactinomyces vulgaris]MBH8582220.1 sigma-54-dependent transcriptional regulator [Thermoactinomyces sp. CICC 10735]
MKTFLIVGGGQGGIAILQTLLSIDFVKVIGVVDLNPDAPAISEAEKHGIPTGRQFEPFLDPAPDVVLEVTGDPKVYDRLGEMKHEDTLLISGAVVDLLIRLVEEKKKWFMAYKRRQQELETILDSTHDGMIAVNKEARITLFNRAAERMIGTSAGKVLGKKIEDVIPKSRLEWVLHNGKAELNQKFKLPSGMEILTNRVPVKGQDGKVIGAVSVFRDISELKNMSQQIIDLESMKSLLQAIIDSSEDAISVVDTNGMGILINPAYTRLTGLKPEDIIGKPADTDISEGESMHMKVLRTKKPVRGVQLKVGPHRKEVLVNVAPIMMEGELKGSVGIIHDVSEIKRLNRDLERARRIIRNLEAKYTFDDIIGSSETMRYSIEQAKQAAETRATVLLRGESGTGKELFAHAIHNASDRKYNQFVRVNCAALSESLLESELFGYEEGAFTGARRGGKKGLFEEANGGTIFLDEIGELKPSTQAKLLRVLQEKEVLRVGGTKSIPIDVRVIAATNVYLEKAIQEKRFREDLYYRLNVLPIHIPPLRMRKEDLVDLARHLIKKFNQEYGRNVEEIDLEAIQTLHQYSWPGNVRELENVLGRAMINMEFNERVMRKKHLPPLDLSRAKEGQDLEGRLESGTDIQPLKDVIQQFEKNYLKKVYEKTNKNKTETAKALGISVRSLYYKLEKYDLI